MKILFESFSGKRVQKTFNTVLEAKEFVLKNKKVIKEATILEGPLGSGNWTPGKALHNIKKGHGRVKNIERINKVKDSYNNDIVDYLSRIAADIENEGNVTANIGVGYNKYGYYLVYYSAFGDKNYAGYRNIEDEDGRVRSITPKSEKYGNKIYMPKLTKYIETHESLPSEKQVKEYMEKIINKRYQDNFSIQKSKKPTSLTSKNDVKDF